MGTGSCEPSQQEAGDSVSAAGRAHSRRRNKTGRNTEVLGFNKDPAAIPSLDSRVATARRSFHLSVFFALSRKACSGDICPGYRQAGRLLVPSVSSPKV